MNRGYVRSWRKTIDSAIFQNEGLFKVSQWCLWRAAYKETCVAVRTGRGISTVKLHPGSFIFGRDSAARELNMHPSTVWKRILKLKKLDFLNIESDSHYSIIYIVNWHIYQAETEKSNSEGDRQVTGKEHKEEIKKEKKNIYSQNALEVLRYLNEKTGKGFTNADYIQARLNNGGTVEDCKKIIDNKVKDQWFIDNPKYLRPSTLFSKKHFDEYRNEAISSPAPQVFKKVFS